jgi:phytanoyl-CoA hydroxylase
LTKVQHDLARSEISNEDVARFRQEGYLVVREFYAKEQIDQIREAFMSEAEGGPVPGLSEIRSGEREYTIEDPLRYYPRMMNPHLHSDIEVGSVSRSFLLDARLLPILTGLLDEEPVGVQTMFYFKPAGARGQALHQDNFYLRVAPGTCMAAWLAVDDADEENGGMVIVPETNGMNIVCPEPADSSRFFTTDFVKPPEGKTEIPVRLKAGDVLFFNGALIHGSYPNSSKNRFRRSLIAHYVPRYSQELSEWYQAITFDGQQIGIAAAVGGGPCGTAQPMVRH